MDAEEKMSSKRTPNAKKSSKAAARTKAFVPEWKCHLDSYADKQLLRFASRADLHAALDLLWTEPFRTLPHDTPDGRTLILPAEAVPYFARAGVKFTATRLREISDLTPEEISKLRR